MCCDFIVYTVTWCDFYAESCIYCDQKILYNGKWVYYNYDVKL